MLIQDLRRNLLAEIYLRFSTVSQVSLELDDIEIEVVERRSHRVKPVLGLNHKLMEAMLVRPLFLLFCQRTIPALTAPFFAGTANPAVKNLPIRTGIALHWVD